MGFPLEVCVMTYKLPSLNCFLLLSLEVCSWVTVPALGTLMAQCGQTGETAGIAIRFWRFNWSRLGALSWNRLLRTLSKNELFLQPTPHLSPWWAEEKWHLQTENESTSISPAWHPDIITIYLEKDALRVPILVNLLSLALIFSLCQTAPD